MTMTPARHRALTILNEGPISATDLIVVGLQRRIVVALVEMGFARYFPRGKPPSWKITPAGRAALKNTRR